MNLEELRLRASATWSKVVGWDEDDDWDDAWDADLNLSLPDPAINVEDSEEGEEKSE